MSAILGRPWIPLAVGLGLTVAGGAGAGVASAQPAQPPWIFAMHDPGAEGEMEAKGKRGWIVFTEAIGHDPNDQSGRDYSPSSSLGHGVIVRLNHGYGSAGTLPHEIDYGNFAQRVANFIQSSPGADIWILGNETNLPREWPGNVDGDANTGEAITPARYVNCFNQVYDELQRRGLTSEILVPAPSGTWAPPFDGTLPPFPDRGVPGFLDYWVQVLNGLGPGPVGGLAIHAYTHGGNGTSPIDPTLVFSDQKMGPPYQDIYYHLRVYRNFMAAIPSALRSLPVWITESNQVRELPGYNWDPHVNTTQWIKNAYAEIHDWNSNASNQKIRALALFRWPDVWEGDRNYCVSCVGTAVEGFRQALDNDYRWDGGTGGCNQSVAVDHWKGEYFPNTTLSGSPSLVRDDGIAALDFDWGGGGPNTCGIGSDRFSARFTRTVFFNAGTYRFTTTTDDGVQLYVDGGASKIDKWFDQGPTPYSVDIPLAAGNHTVVMHYYENGGGAVAKVSWSFLGGGGAPLDADVLDSSAVPASLAPGETRSVTVRVQNTGTETWTADTLVRLGTLPDNTVTWSGFTCGGFANHPGDSRAYLCQSVPSGGTAELTFNITAPASGPAVLSVQMVKELVAWFGEKRTFPIASGGGPCSMNVGADHWKGEYSPNATLSGPPSLVRDDGIAAVDLDWGTGGPNACGIGSDRFSARWTRTITLGAGTYRFSARVDDGVRVWIDDTLYLDQWIIQAPTTYAFEVNLAAGAHVIKMEYFENDGLAVAQLSWQALGDACSQSVASDHWKGEYFPNATLSGPPSLVRDDGIAAVDLDWGTGGPNACGIGSDRFSARWTRTITLGAGTYRFSARVDDGVRVWIDNTLYLDKWIIQSPTTYAFDANLPAGAHVVKMEYFENDGLAVAQLSWQLVGGGCANNPLDTPGDRWKLEIFNGRDLAGDTVERRYDAVGSGGFSFDWGAGGPSNCAGSDNFGIRFSRTISIDPAGEYKFTTTTDDGVRLWVDGQLLIDHWVDQAPTSWSGTRFLAAGSHDVRMDYYENGGGAVAALRWESVGSGALYGVNVDPANPRGNPSAQELTTLGARWVRMEWKATPGAALYDAKLPEYRNAGLKVLLIVDYASVPGSPGSGGTDSQWAAYVASFVSGARSLAQRYGNGVDAWQIWNEPDLAPQPGYDVYVPPGHYGVMLRDAATAIRSFSARPVITGGLASGDPSYLTRARDAVGGLTVDAVAVHPYGQRAPDNWPNPTWGFGNMSDLFNRYLAFGKPLWVSEVGVNTPDGEFQANYLENVYRLAETQYPGRVPVVFWFCWSDGMVPPFGLLDANGNPKPAYHRYQAVAP